MRIIIFLLALISMLFLHSFNYKFSHQKLPGAITKTSILIEGNQLERTVIKLDKNTSREDLISTCSFLAKENVQLTFDKLIIGKSFLGLIGKQRIRIAEGKIQLSNGVSQKFKAGGITSFNFIKIQYLNSVATKYSIIEMIEIVD